MSKSDNKNNDNMLTLRELHNRHVELTKDYKEIVYKCITEIVTQRVEFVKYLNIGLHCVGLLLVITTLIIINYKVDTGQTIKLLLLACVLVSGYICLIILPNKLFKEINNEMKETKERRLYFGSNLWDTFIVASLPIQIIQNFDIDEDDIKQYGNLMTNELSETCKLKEDTELRIIAGLVTVSSAKLCLLNIFDKNVYIKQS